jgi:putative ABC transport system substrate-binding protein
MRRRDVVALLSGTIVVWPLGVAGRSGSKPSRIGVLAGASLSTFPFTRRFPSALARLGYNEGIDIVLDWRSAEDDSETLTMLADGLVALAVDVIVAITNPEIFAAQRATTSIPIIMVAAADPVGTGLVPSLSRPGGNVTGSAWFPSETAGKIVAILKDAAPGSSRVGFVCGAEFPGKAGYVDAMSAAAMTVGIGFDTVEVGRAADVADVLAAFQRGPGDALIVSTTAGNMHAILAYAAQHRIPAIYMARGWVDSGGLMGYLPSVTEAVERTARYVDRILKGARPGELPVEQPTRFELVVNLKTARAIGLELPPSLLAAADEVIE